MRPTEDLNVLSSNPIIAPEDLKQVFPAAAEALELVARSRGRFKEIMFGRDPSMVAVVGPCSIHDAAAAREYARRLAALSKEVEDKLLIVMRVYFEKPRTTIGWKGMISDPDLDGTNRMSKGLGIARGLLCDITGMGLPVGTETLSPLNPQYFADLISWGGIGARTSQSQTHREMVSGLSFPVGIKNGTNGDLSIAIDAMGAARSGHSFLGISHDGRAAIIETNGNPNVHLVLRGSDTGPNFSPEHVAEASARLTEKKLPPGIVVDCSHGNSYKQYERQGEALENVMAQVADGDSSLCGFMLESFLEAGNQKIPEDLSQLTYGLSVTDQCIDWETTEKLIRDAHSVLTKCGGRKL